MFDEALISEIKFRCEVEDVIGSYVSLQRAGSNLKGLCPFHSEKTPSFVVFPKTRSFYCFGCGAGGDVVTFIMRAENLDYPAALEFLAKRAGIPLPENGREHGGGGIRRSRLFEMNRDAARYFRDRLLHSDEAKAYLAKRGLSSAAVKRFGLGWAERDFGALTRFMRDRGYTQEELVMGNLCGVSKKSGGLYDFFRGRLMIPIIDVSGNVVAFGGRVVAGGEEPKYLNSSDTPAFKKGRNLFALNYAKSCCQESLILCEGYMDVIALHDAGFGNAVAGLGTAFTAEQARLMAKYTKQVVLCYDSDAAGQRAASRTMPILDEVGLPYRVLKLQGAKDPDEFIHTFGAPAFRRALGEGQSGFDFRLAGVLARCDVSTTEGQIQAARELSDILAETSSSVERGLYIARAAQALSVSPEMLRSDVERQRALKRRDARRAERQEVYREAARYGDRVNPDAVKNVRGAAAEEVILGLIMLYPELRAAVRSGGVQLEKSDFVTAFHARVFEAVISYDEEKAPFDFGLLGAQFSPEEMGRITKMCVEREGFAANGMALLRDCVRTLKGAKTKSLEETIHEQRTKIKGNV